MMISEDKILCLTFEVALSSATGTLAMVFPAVIANALLRRLCSQSSFSERIPSRESRSRVRERLLDSRFVANLNLPLSSLPVRQLIDLEVGQVLALPKSAREPIHLNVAGKSMFLAYPVRQASRRSARIDKRLSVLAPSNSEQA